MTGSPPTPASSSRIVPVALTPVPPDPKTAPRGAESTKVKYSLGSTVASPVTATETAVTVYLHPRDAELVHGSAAGGEPAWKLVADDGIERGGCRVETRMSEVDATVERRVEMLRAALGA